MFFIQNALEKFFIQQERNSSAFSIQAVKNHLMKLCCVNSQAQTNVQNWVFQLTVDFWASEIRGLTYFGCFL